MQRLLLNRNCVIAAWVGLFLSAISPPTGLGVRLCLFHSATGIDCVGCGLTRSLSCALRGLFAQSWNYHPMGILILPLFLAIALQSILPRIQRDKIRSFVERHPVAFKRFYILFFGTFVTFGVVRAMVEMMS
jgi:hypothetical protein